LPESRHKYLYERLGSHDFQLLVNAVMPHAFQGYRPLPLGQSDGGRDGIQVVDGNTLVFQVKWSSTGREKNPVSWLDNVVVGEEQNLRRLAAEGVRRYMLVTNLSSTGRPGTGTFDRLNEKFDAHAKAYGFEEMTCIWREGLDGFLDSVPPEVKWEYAEMLAGWDLIRYLINEQFGAKRDKGLRDLVRKVVATQWGEDELVKFSQSDVDRERVADLFIDVTGERLRTVGANPPTGLLCPSNANALIAARDVHIGGTAAYLLKPAVWATLVRGAPGQGKSTLSQYVSQAHRSAFLPEGRRPSNLPSLKDKARFPLRLDLSEYSRWLHGIDVFDPSETERPSKRRKKRSGAQSTLECFLGELMTYASGGAEVGADAVHDLFDRVPTLVVLDGLDEVGSPKTRATVVDAINKFTVRCQTYPVPVQVVVTTRPSNNELPEPDAELFEVIVLNELTVEERDEYLRKWCTVHGIHGREGRDMRKSFKEKSAEPYIAELAGNPMQLTILLDLIHERGAATPTQRTELYDNYVELLLARESNKYPEAVRKHREQLKEIIPFLGWYLQSRSEEHSLPGRMKVGELQGAMRHFQQCYGKREGVVDELFDAVSDRLWALTSKTDGTFELEVLSLREYFAARFLYKWAGEDIRLFDRTVVMRELLRRPQWLNTARFYGGNAQGGDVAVLADGILDELRDGCTPQARAAAWTLVTDGVFQSRPRDARDVIDALLSDDGITALLESLHRNEVRPLPELPVLHETAGPDAAWTRLTAEIAADPSSVSARARVQAVRELLNQRSEFAVWWTTQMTAAVGTRTERPWLELAAKDEAGAGVSVDLHGLDLEADRAAEHVLNTGLVPTAGGNFEARLLQAVLDGECPNVNSIRSMPAQVAVALRPSAFISWSETGFELAEPEARRRTEAIARLRRTAPAFAKAAALRRFKSGQKGSTFPWANTASALYEHAGRCWLASEIAIIGAAHSHRAGGRRIPDAVPFGPNSPRRATCSDATARQGRELVARAARAGHRWRNRRAGGRRVGAGSVRGRRRLCHLGPR
jgi:hypothetical protein